MNNTRIVLSALALTLSCSFAHADKKADRKAAKEAKNAAIMEACKEDITTSGCSGKEMGKGLLKCMHTYHKAHKEYKMTPTCEEATKSMHKQFNSKQDS